MSVLRTLMCCLTVFVSRNSMLLGFFVLSHFVVMDSFTVVVRRRLVMAGCIVVVLAGGMFHGHGMRPFKKKRAVEKRSPYRTTSKQRYLRRCRFAMRLTVATSKLPA